MLKILLALMFLGGAGYKLSGAPSALALFDRVGLGQWFRFFTAACEICGAVLLLWPRTAFYGAILTAAVCAGSFVAQIAVLHGDTIHTLVQTALLLFVAWVHRDRASLGKQGLG